jgi:AraC-like DNA-binding protein
LVGSEGIRGAVPTPLRSGNILAAAADGVESFIDRHGGNAKRVLALSGVAETALEDPKLSLNLASYVGMMEQAARETRNDNFGLWFGQQFQPCRLGLIGNIALASPTLGAALDNLSRLFAFHQQQTETRITWENNLLRLEYRVLDGCILERRQDSELTMGMFANIFRHCLGDKWAPEQVHFEHVRPEAPRDHERAFNAPVHFGQRTNALVFRDQHLNRRMPAGDLARLTRLQDELIRLAGTTGEVPFIGRVRAEIRSALSDGYPHVECIADALQMPRWTFQRRLADHGYTFSQVVEIHRRDIAMLYVRQPHIPIVDIAYMLGYSELSAFSRAFARWFGIPPQSARQLWPSL